MDYTAKDQAIAELNLINKVQKASRARDSVSAQKELIEMNLTVKTINVFNALSSLDACEVDTAKAAEAWLAVFYSRYPERKP